MSFPKAKIKRFNEVEDDGAPVGAYDPKSQDKSICAPFLKGTRFHKSDQDLADSSASHGESSGRKMFLTMSSFKMPSRTRSFMTTTQSAKVHECEKEIKRLLSERSSLLKQLTSKEEDCRRLDGKLQAALREKTSLKASLVSFERENKELRRMSEILTMKMTTIETVDRKKDLSHEILSLNEQLMRKGHEIHDLRAELTQVRCELEEAVVTIGTKNNELGELQMSVDEKAREAEARLDATCSELHDLQQRHRDLAENSDVMHDQMHNLMETILQNEAVVTELQSQNSGLLREKIEGLREYDAKCEELRGTVASVMELEINDLHCTLKAQSTALLEREVELKTSNTRLESMISDMKNVQCQISYLQLEKRGLEERVYVLADDLGIANKSLENEIVVRIEMNGIVEAKKKALVELESLVSEGDSRIASLERKERELTEAKQLAEDKLLAQKIEIDAALAKIHENDVSNEQQLQTIRDDLRRSETAKHDAEMMFLDVKNMRNLLHGELRTLQGELQASEEKLQASEEAKRELSELVTDLLASEAKKDNELHLARQKIDEQENTVYAQKANVERLTVEVANKQAILENVREEASRLVTTVEEKEEEIADLKVIVEKNQQLIFDKTLFEDLTQLLNDISEKNVNQVAVIEETCQKLNLADETVAQQKREIQRHVANAEWFKDREKDLMRELEVSEEKSRVEEQGFKKSIGDALKKLSAMESQQQAYREEKEKEGQQNEQLLQSLTNEYERKLKTIQEKEWMKMYEELLAKVEPFMEQLNAYEIERKVLLSKNRETKSDLEKLSDQYATLLGHQNHKQKIHHVTKLKEENLGLKEENTKLWTEVLKYRKIMPRRESIIPGSMLGAGQRPSNLSSSAAKPFGSAKVFKRPSDKENASPLRDRNVI